MCEKDHKNTYAEKFFDKPMKPGVMGKGFVGVIEEDRKKKPKKLFVGIDDLME
jgi:hypothetical protein